MGGKSFGLSNSCLIIDYENSLQKYKKNFYLPNSEAIFPIKSLTDMANKMIPKNFRNT